MPLPLSNDLGVRLVECAEACHSRREAAERFKTAASSAVNVVRLWNNTGSVKLKLRCGFWHGKLKPHREFILGIVAKRPDIMMPELSKELLAAKDVVIDLSNLSKFMIGCDLSFKKQPFGEASKTGLNWLKQGPNGERSANPLSASSRHRWS